MSDSFLLNAAFIAILLAVAVPLARFVYKIIVSPKSERLKAKWDNLYISLENAKSHLHRLKSGATVRLPSEEEIKKIEANVEHLEAKVKKAHDAYLQYCLKSGERPFVRNLPAS